MGRLPLNKPPRPKILWQIPDPTPGTLKTKASCFLPAHASSSLSFEAPPAKRLSPAPAFPAPCLPILKPLLVRTQLCLHRVCLPASRLINCAATNVAPVIFVPMCTNCPTTLLVCFPI
jgi:hypothetical protein